MTRLFWRVVRRGATRAAASSVAYPVRVQD
jgi:hypothetical protein